jgi:hypothetical protein
LTQKPVHWLITTVPNRSSPTEDPVVTSCISPDGKFLAYSVRAGVHVRVIASGETHRPPGTEGMEVFACSPTLGCLGPEYDHLPLGIDVGESEREHLAAPHPCIQ